MFRERILVETVGTTEWEFDEIQNKKVLVLTGIWEFNGQYLVDEENNPYTPIETFIVRSINWILQTVMKIIPVFKTPEDNNTFCGWKKEELERLSQKRIDKG